MDYDLDKGRAGLDEQITKGRIKFYGVTGDRKRIELMPYVYSDDGDYKRSLYELRRQHDELIEIGGKGLRKFLRTAENIGTLTDMLVCFQLEGMAPVHVDVDFGYLCKRKKIDGFDSFPAEYRSLNTGLAQFKVLWHGFLEYRMAERSDHVVSDNRMLWYERVKANNRLFPVGTKKELEGYKNLRDEQLTAVVERFL